jgi:hypothetical protein
MQAALAAVAATDGSFLYTKFFAVGLFRLVELTGGAHCCIRGSCVCFLRGCWFACGSDWVPGGQACVVACPPLHPPPPPPLVTAGSKDPKSLSSLVKALGLSQERVNADLMTYKGVLSKLEAAKEIMKEFIAREKKVRAGGAGGGCRGQGRVRVFFVFERGRLLELKLSGGGIRSSMVGAVAA